MTRSELKTELRKLLDSKGNITPFYTRESYLRSHGLWDDLQSCSHSNQSPRNQMWEVLLNADPTCIICGSLCALDSEGRTKRFYKTCSTKCAGLVKKGKALHLSDAVKTAAAEKRKKTMLKKYGVAYNSQRQEVKPLIIAHCKTDKFKQQMRDLHPPADLDWSHISERNKTKSVPSIAMELGVSPSLLYNRSKKEGIVLQQHGGISVEESKIIDILSATGIGTYRNTKNIIPPYELDVVVPALKLAIEVDGLYWHGHSRNTPKQYHINKTDLCKDAGWQLLHFWDIEVNGKPDIVKSVLMSKCGLSNRVYARNLTVGAVDWKQAHAFMTNNHLQGHAQFSGSVGLFDKDKLVCCITYGHNRFEKTKTTEIIRFASALNTTVVGGFSRLISKLDRPIVSYANLRFSNGNVYRQCGFRCIGKSAPCPWYTNDHKRLYHRSKLMKKNLHKLGIVTEGNETAEAALARSGWDWVYDCGNLKFILDTPN